VVLALKDIDQGVRFATGSIHQTNSETGELLKLADILGMLLKQFKVSNGEDDYINVSENIPHQNAVKELLAAT
jgi:hypothetical protein